MIEKLLQYQKLDGELRKVNRELATCPERVTMNKMITFVKDAQNKISAFGRKADELLAEYDREKAEYSKTLKTIEKLSKIDVSKSKGDSLEGMANQINTASSELFGLEKKLNAISSKSRSVLRDFSATRDNVIKARNMHKDSRNKYDNLEQSLKPKKAEILSKMAALEKEADKTMLAKYKSMRNDNIFPVFVPVKGTLCGGCRMAVPSGQLDKLKSTKMAHCEQCGRILYVED